MRGLGELPETTKDDLSPIILLRPWVGAHHLEAAIAKINESYGDRSYFLDFDEYYVPDGNRPVVKELQQLKRPDNNFSEWVNFCRENPNIVPSMQFSTEADPIATFYSLAELDRGVLVRFSSRRLDHIDRDIDAIATAIRETNCAFNIDLGDNFDEHFQAIGANNIIKHIADITDPQAIIFTASSFPSNFTNLTRSNIEERLAFDQLSQKNRDLPLIYGDRGSARIPSIGGGGGLPAPRIDYPIDQEWAYFRVEAEYEHRPDAYRLAAQRVIQSVDWNPEIRIWGTQMIERTAAGEGDISSPAFSTSVRINIHLHRQRSYGDTDILFATDDDYID